MLLLPLRHHLVSLGAVMALAIVPLLFSLIALLQSPARGVTGLHLAVAERLALIPDVARHKWNTAAAITDPERERRIIEAAVVYGRRFGLSDRVTQVAIEAQINAAKQMQHELIQSWRQTGQGVFGFVPDFIRETRPKIEEATRRLIRELAAALGTITTCSGATALRHPPSVGPASVKVWSTAVDGLIQSAGGPPNHACSPP